MFLSTLLNSFSQNAPKSNRRKQVISSSVMIERFEDRCLLSNVDVFPAIPAIPPGTSNAPPTGKMNPLTSIPRLNSLPGASVTVYLDFDGHSESQDWPGVRTDGGTGPIVTPVFDVDNDFTTFSDEELRMIEEMWYRMSEDFSSFNINVTTVDPGSYNDFQGMRVSFGGNGAWIGSPGGIAFLNSFNGGPVNTCYVFTDNTGKGSIDHSKGSSLAGSHEVGHTLGLDHNAVYDANGNQTAGYDSGRPNLGPIMGAPYGSARETWSNAPGVVNVTTLQDDLAIITGARNQTVTFRVDDHGNTISSATNIPVVTPTISARGVIETNGDIDMFRFQTDSGPISLSVAGLDLSSVYGIPTVNPGTNLDSILSLYNSAGTLIMQSDPGNSLSASISTTVASGTYYVGVSSIAQYGSLGQYTLTGTVIPLPVTPTLITPTGTLSTLFPKFEWTAGSNAASYQLEVANLTTGVAIYYTQTVTTTSHTAVTPFAQGNFQARVRTVAGNNANSPWSNVVQFTVDIPDPQKPKVTRPQGPIGDSFPVFEWGKNTNDASYSVWVNRIVGNSSTRVVYATGLALNTYTHFSPLPDGDYVVWVRAFNVLGEFSNWSDPVSFKITAPIPTKPVITAPTATTNEIRPRFVWSSVEGVARYDLQIDNLSTQTTQFIREQNLTRTQAFYDPTKDLTQGNYVAMVRAINGNGVAGPWSNAYAFTVDVLPPAVSTVTGPVPAIGSSVIPTVTPTFTWRAVARAATYDLWVNNITTNQIQIIRKTDLTTTSFTPTVGLPQGNYRAWVRGINIAGEVGVWSPMFTFTIDEPTPSVPSITAPVPNPAGSVENDLPTIQWASAVAAPFYDLEIDNSTLKLTNVISVTGLREAQYTIPTSQRLGEFTYVARVRARNSSGDLSAWSPAYTIRIDIPNPSTPVIVGPTDTSSNTTPKFLWTHSAGNVRYEILVRDLVRNESKVILVSNLQLAPGGLNAFYTVPASSPLTPSTYRFWIRAFNSQGMASSWSASQTFVISAKLDTSILKLQGLMEETDTVLLSSLQRKAIPRPAAAEGQHPVAPEAASVEVVSHNRSRAWVMTLPEGSVAAATVESVEDLELIDSAMSLLSDPRSRALGES